jgi:hypothetical protein
MVCWGLLNVSVSFVPDFWQQQQQQQQQLMMFCPQAVVLAYCVLQAECVCQTSRPLLPHPWMTLGLHSTLEMAILSHPLAVNSVVCIVVCVVLISLIG